MRFFRPGRRPDTGSLCPECQSRLKIEILAPHPAFTYAEVCPNHGAVAVMSYTSQK